eukprot:TRINITY_DN6922_c0_g1_i2.p1 TRINITY_DN6922_c0_g1~~TRINITY_DN6922_c0_g1_i2.p1  ORF type:complete len:313 (-),score=43.52 TRINITY_DN6922_c0_g1_i2:72-1010(-)
MGAAARIAGFFSWLLPSAIGGLAGEMLHRRLVFEALRGKQRKLGGHLIDPGGSQTQRWTGVQSSKYTDKLKEVQCNFLVPDKIFELGDGEAHYVYCDIHYNAWPDGSFGQFVPQLMRGEVLAANDASYGPNDTLLEDWHIQAQYVWGGGGRPVQAFVGQLIKVHAGDKVTTRMYADMSGAWVLSIAVEGGQASAIVVTVPFMGTHPQYQLPYGSRDAPQEYSRWVLGDLHEAWGMDAADYYPVRMDWTVLYRENDELPKTHQPLVNQTAFNHCFDHQVQKDCLCNVMTPVLDAQSFGLCRFHVERAHLAILV